jgi:hypothetical protein
MKRRLDEVKYEIFGLIKMSIDAVKYILKIDYFGTGNEYEA